MYLLQSLYAFILNPVYKITDKIDNKVKNVVFALMCLCLMGYFPIFFSVQFHDYMRKSHTLNSIICSLMLFVIIIFSINGELKPVKWNKFVFYVFFFSGLGVFVISFLHPIGSGYRAWGLLMMFGFPCLYYVWNNRGDYEKLYNRLSAATVIVGIAYYALNFVLASKGKLVMVIDRMNGTFYDANMYSMIGMVMVSCSMYMLLVNRHSRGWFALTALGFGIGTDIVILGASRLSMLVILGSVLAFTIYYIKCGREFRSEKSRSSRWLRAEILFISMVVFLVAGRFMVNINIQAIENQTTSQIQTVIENPPTTLGGGSLYGGALDRFDTEGKDIDSYTAGRYHIWQGYAQFLNMTGNDFSKADWNALTMKTVKHAHNNFLEIGYRCGIPVAILHTILELLAGVICVIWLFGRKYKDSVYLFSIVFMITYAIQSMFDIATIPFERPAPFFFYMAMIPIFTFSFDKEEKHRPKH